MLFAGLPGMGWQDFVYENIVDIGRSDMALARWLRPVA